MRIRGQVQQVIEQVDIAQRVEPERDVKRRLHHLLGSSVDAPAIGRIQSLGVDADQGTRRPDRRGRSVRDTATLLGVEFLIGWADQGAHNRPAKAGRSVSHLAFGALYIGANLRVGRQCRQQEENESKALLVVEVE